MSILNAIWLGAFICVVLGTVAAVFGLAYAAVCAGMKVWEKCYLARQSKRRATAVGSMKGFYSEELLDQCPEPQAVANRLFPKVETERMLSANWKGGEEE